MPAVSFYLLATASESLRYNYVCKLVEKIYRSGSQVFILTDSHALSRRLDDLLWTFRAGSFIPHQLYTGAESEALPPVMIGESILAELKPVNILNLAQTIPEQFSGVERILEVLDADENCKQTGRLRYRGYQQLGCDINTIRVPDN